MARRMMECVCFLLPSRPIEQPTWRRKALFYPLGWMVVLVQLVFDPLNTLCWYAD